MRIGDGHPFGGVKPQAGPKSGKEITMKEAIYVCADCGKRVVKKELYSVRDEHGATVKEVCLDCTCQYRHPSRYP